MSSRSVGDEAELLACEYLMMQGCRIIERNFYTRMGEIDIIAEKGGVIRFVEVKSGRTFEPIYNITPVKLQRIIQSAQTWLKKRQVTMPWQIDAVIVRGGEIEWLENVTV